MRNSGIFINKKMTILIVGFIAALFVHRGAWADDLQFYDDDDNQIARSSLSQLSINGGCAFDGSAKIAYNCFGGCDSTLNTTYRRVDVMPNGSYFKQGTTTYICSADRKWYNCASSGTGWASGSGSIQIRMGCPGGYKQFFISNLVEGSSRIDSFCSYPWDALHENYDNFFQDSALSCQRQDGNATIYSYTSCKQNYRYDTSTRNCISCGNPANGHYNTDNNISAVCQLMCDNGYYNNNGNCVSNGGTSGAACPDGQFDMDNYGGSGCRACPSGSKCDGNYVFCPVGNYIFSKIDGNTPYCRKCPGHGQVMAEYDDKFNGCDGNFFGYTKNQTTTCLWTDYIDDHDDSCFESIGSDTTGQYEFRNSGGTLTQCRYEY